MEMLPNGMPVTTALSPSSRTTLRCPRTAPPTIPLLMKHPGKPDYIVPDLVCDPMISFNRTIDEMPRFWANSEKLGHHIRGD